MQRRTRHHYEDSISKLGMLVTAVRMGSCEPIDLFAQPEVHLLVLEGLERLTAIVCEGTGFRVNWAPPADCR